MKITEFLSDMGTSMANGYIENLKEQDSEKLDQIIKMFNNLSELALNVLKENDQFRTNFARIHSEFLKYPECREVIEGSMEAYKKYKSQIM